MSHSAALPFRFRRKQDVMGMMEITSTTETVDGLLRLDGERLVIQWRLTRATERVGMQIRTDRELEPVREVVIPLSALAGARVRRLWWRWPPGPHLVLTAADLRAFEEVAGEEGLGLDHPAELVLYLRRSDRLQGEEFAAELELAVAEHALRAADEAARLGSGGAPSLAPGQDPSSDLAPGQGETPERLPA